MNVDFLDKVIRTIEKHGMLRCGGRTSLVLGLSGGMDSMCLLDALLRLSEGKVYETAIFAAHVNHGLRGGDADADAAFCREYCETRGVGFREYRADVAALAKRGGLSVEEAGREERARVFREAAAEQNADAIALAHHMNDNAETVLMRLGRGTGLTGAAGILPKGNGIIRPFSDVTREEIAAYAEENNLPYREDATNVGDAYTRNRVRHVLIPQFRGVFGHDAVRTIARFAQIASEENEFLDEAAAKLLAEAVAPCEPGENAVSIPILTGAHPALVKRALRLIIRNMPGGGKDVSQTNLDEVLHLLKSETGKEIFLAGSLRVRRSYERLIFEKYDNINKITAEFAGFCEELHMDGAVYVPQIRQCFTMSRQKKDCWKNCDNICTKVFKYDRIIGNVDIRTRRQGDRVTLKNLGTQKLSDYFVNNKLPKESRDSVPLVANGADIMWILDERNTIGAEYSAIESEDAQRVYIQTWGLRDEGNG